MSAKRVLAAALLLVGSYLAAGSLMHWTSGGDLQDPAGVAPMHPAPDTSNDVARTGPAKTGATESPAGANQSSADTKAKNIAPQKPAGPSQIARFVELSLNTGKPRFLAGRAPKGATVTVFKGGTIIGTARTSNTGNWSIPLDQPITDKTYSLTLNSTGLESDTSGVGDTSVVIGQSADIVVDETGRATVSIKPPTTIAAVGTIPSADIASPATSKKTIAANGRKIMTGAGVSGDPPSGTIPAPANIANAPSASENPPARVEEPESGLKETVEPAKGKKTANAGTENPEEEKPVADTPEEETGNLDGILDQASRMAEAATEKFSDIIGAGDADTDKPAPAGSDSKSQGAPPLKTASPEKAATAEITKDSATIVAPEGNTGRDTTGKQIAATSAGSNAGSRASPAAAIREKRIKRTAHRRSVARRRQQAIARARMQQRTARRQANRQSRRTGSADARYIKSRAGNPPTNVRLTRLNRSFPRRQRQGFRTARRLKPRVGRPLTGNEASRYLRRIRP